MVILSADDWVCSCFVCCLDGSPAQGAMGGWVVPGLVFRWFPCVSAHYLILPRVTSLVV